MKIRINEIEVDKTWFNKSILCLHKLDNYPLILEFYSDKKWKKY